MLETTISDRATTDAPDQKHTFAVGIISLPIYLILILGAFIGLGKPPTDISAMIALLSAAAIFATFIPFAQIATRIGGAATITIALAPMRIYG